MPDSPQHAIEVNDLTIGQHQWRLPDDFGQQWSVGQTVQLDVAKTGETLSAQVVAVDDDGSVTVEFPPYEGVSIPEGTAE